MTYTVYTLYYIHYISLNRKIKKISEFTLKKLNTLIENHLIFD